MIKGLIFGILYFVFIIGFSIFLWSAIIQGLYELLLT